MTSKNIAGECRIVYRKGVRAQAFQAELASGVVFDITAGRGRAYPGLPSSAPDTRALYQLALQELRGSRVLDAGSGSGVGSQMLASKFVVLGVDQAADTVEFARAFAPNVEFRVGNLCRSSNLPEIDCAVCIDTLGHLEDPLAFLLELREHLTTGNSLFIAEPLAYASQRLLAPQRRAFSRAGLSSLLTQAGFEVEAWYAENHSFVCVRARRSDTAEHVQLLDILFDSQGAAAAPNDAAFEALIGSSPQSVRNELWLAWAERSLQDKNADRALAQLLELRKIDANEARADLEIAALLLSARCDEDALHFALGAVGKDPTSASALLTLARAAERALPGEAFKAWKLCATLAPDNVHVCRAYARSLAVRAQFSAAVRCLEQLRSYGDKLDSQFHLELAQLLLKAGRRPDATLEAQLALTLAPEDPQVRAFHALLLQAA